MGEVNKQIPNPTDLGSILKSLEQVEVTLQNLVSGLSGILNDMDQLDVKRAKRTRKNFELFKKEFVAVVASFLDLADIAQEICDKDPTITDENGKKIAVKGTVMDTIKNFTKMMKDVIGEFKGMAVDLTVIGLLAATIAISILGFDIFIKAVKKMAEASVELGKIEIPKTTKETVHSLNEIMRDMVGICVSASIIGIIGIPAAIGLLITIGLVKLLQIIVKILVSGFNAKALKETEEAFDNLKKIFFDMIIIIAIMALTGLLVMKAMGLIIIGFLGFIAITLMVLLLGGLLYLVQMELDDTYKTIKNLCMICLMLAGLAILFVLLGQLMVVGWKLMFYGIATMTMLILYVAGIMMLLSSDLFKKQIQRGIASMMLITIAFGMMALVILLLVLDGLLIQQHWAAALFGLTGLTILIGMALGVMVLLSLMKKKVIQGAIVMAILATAMFIMSLSLILIATAGLIWQKVPTLVMLEMIGFIAAFGAMAALLGTYPAALAGAATILVIAGAMMVISVSLIFFALAGLIWQNVSPIVMLEMIAFISAFALMAALIGTFPIALVGAMIIGVLAASMLLIAISMLVMGAAVIVFAKTSPEDQANFFGFIMKMVGIFSLMAVMMPIIAIGSAAAMLFSTTMFLLSSSMLLAAKAVKSAPSESQVEEYKLAIKGMIGVMGLFAKPKNLLKITVALPGIILFTTAVTMLSTVSSAMVDISEDFVELRKHPIDAESFAAAIVNPIMEVVGLIKKMKFKEIIASGFKLMSIQSLFLIPIMDLVDTLDYTFKQIKKTKIDPELFADGLIDPIDNVVDKLDKIEYTSILASGIKVLTLNTGLVWYLKTLSNQLASITKTVSSVSLEKDTLSIKLIDPISGAIDGLDKIKLTSILKAGAKALSLNAGLATSLIVLSKQLASITKTISSVSLEKDTLSTKLIDPLADVIETMSEIALKEIVKASAKAAALSTGFAPFLKLLSSEMVGISKDVSEVTLGPTDISDKILLPLANGIVGMEIVAIGEIVKASLKLALLNTTFVPLIKSLAASMVEVSDDVMSVTIGKTDITDKVIDPAVDPVERLNEVSMASIFGAIIKSGIMTLTLLPALISLAEKMAEVDSIISELTIGEDTVSKKVIDPISNVIDSISDISLKEVLLSSVKMGVVNTLLMNAILRTSNKMVKIDENLKGITLGETDLVDKIINPVTELLGSMDEIGFKDILWTSSKLSLINLWLLVTISKMSKSIKDVNDNLSSVTMSSDDFRTKMIDPLVGIVEEIMEVEFKNIAIAGAKLGTLDILFSLPIKHLAEMTKELNEVLSQATIDPNIFSEKVLNPILHIADIVDEVDFMHLFKAGIKMQTISSCLVGPVEQMMDVIRGLINLTVKDYDANGKVKAVRRITEKDFDLAEKGIISIITSLGNAISGPGVIEAINKAGDLSKKSIKRLSALTDPIHLMIESTSSVVDIIKKDEKYFESDGENGSKFAQDLSSIIFAYTSMLDPDGPLNKERLEALSGSKLVKALNDEHLGGLVELSKEFGDRKFDVEKQTKAVDNIDRLIEKTNTIDTSKVKSVTDMFREMKEFSESIDGNFEKLAEVLNDKLIDSLDRLNHTLENASEYEGSAGGAAPKAPAEKSVPIGTTEQQAKESARPMQDYKRELADILKQARAAVAALEDISKNTRNRPY